MTGTISNYAGTIGSKIFSSVVLIFVIRYLTVSEYGTYNLMYGLLPYFAVLTTFGLRSTLRRFLPEYNVLKQTYKMKSLIKFSFLFSLTMSVIIFLIIVILSGLLARLLQNQYLIHYLKIFGIALIFLVQIQIFEAILRSFFEQKLVNIGRIGYLIFKSVFFIAVITYDLGIIGLFVSEIIASLILLIFFIFVLSKNNSLKSDRINYNKFEKKRIIRFSLLSFFQESGGSIFDVSTDYIIISILLGSEMVGIYSFSIRNILLLFQLIPVIMAIDIIKPLIYQKYAAHRDNKELVDIFKMVNKLLFFFALPIIAGVIVFGKQAIPLLFGEKYADSYIILVLVGSFYLVNLLQYSLGILLFTLEKVEYALYSRLFSIYNIFMDILLIKKFGIIGVPIATGTTILFSNIMIILLLKRHITFGIKFSPYLRMVINCVISGGLIFIFKEYINNLWSLVLGGLLLILVYIFLSKFNRIFTDIEVIKINSLIGKKVF